MTYRDDQKRAGHVGTDEAKQILVRFNNSHFRSADTTRRPGETAHYSIPADPLRDSDIRLSRFIAQYEIAINALREIEKIEQCNDEITLALLGQNLTTHYARNSTTNDASNALKEIESVSVGVR